MHQAEDMLETGQYEDAISLYDKAIKKEKSLLTLVTGKAQAEIKAGKLEAAIKTYSRAMEMSPNNATVLFNRGVVYQKMGNLKEAIKDYSRSAEILPGNQKVHFNCSLALKKLGHFEEALDEIDIALEIDPQSTDALFNKANILMKLKEFKKAVEVLEKVSVPQFASTCVTNFKGRQPRLILEMKSSGRSSRASKKKRKYGSWLNLNEGRNERKNTTMASLSFMDIIIEKVKQMPGHKYQLA